jgi:hypothetical protein
MKTACSGPLRSSGADTRRRPGRRGRSGHAEAFEIVSEYVEVETGKGADAPGGLQLEPAVEIRSCCTSMPR